MKPYDICVITAANSQQAEGYRRQLSWRSEQGILPEETEFLVYADPQGKRIGSGGSTIYVLCKLLEDSGYSFDQIGDFYEKKRILILHSGGDSRRLPAYSAVAQDSILARDSWTSIIYGIEDSFKYSVEEDECSFLNSNFSDWIEENGVSPKELWKEDEPHELWNARLFSVSNEAAKAVRLSLALQKNYSSIDEWKAASRMSLQEILNSIDYDRLLLSYFEIDRKTKLRNITRTLTPDNYLSSEEILSWCHEKEDYETLFEDVTDLIKQSDNLLFQARLYKLLSQIAKEMKSFC